MKLILKFFLVLSRVNVMFCIVWAPGAAVVPDLQGPLTSLLCNLAANARALLTLLIFCQLTALFLPLNCIRFYIFTHTYIHTPTPTQSKIIPSVWYIPDIDSLGYDYHVQRTVIYDKGVRLYLNTSHIICHCLLSFDLFSRCGYLSQKRSWPHSWALWGKVWS